MDRSYENIERSIRERAKLTARPTKCVVAVMKVEYFGHIIADGKVKPNPEKVISSQSCSRPKTKIQVRSFIGLIGYYRRFKPNFSATSAPLTDLTKKGKPMKVRWEAEHEDSFRSLIHLLGKSTILRLPNFDKEFVVRTDATDTGIGAVLLQDYEDHTFPVSYASKKLSERERSYSVIEKECLAVIRAIQKYGKPFILETYHEPLVYLNKTKCAYARFMHWALALQPFKTYVVSIKGSENAGAYFLSRIY